MGVGRGGKVPLGFKLYYFAINVSVEKCFSFSFGVDKMKFHHCWPTLEEILLNTPEKNPFDHL